MKAESIHCFAEYVRMKYANAEYKTMLLYIAAWLKDIVVWHFSQRAIISTSWKNIGFGAAFSLQFNITWYWLEINCYRLPLNSFRVNIYHM